MGRGRWPAGPVGVAATLLVAVLGAAVTAGCGGSSTADDPCPRAVIEWDDGPSPYRDDVEAAAGFVDAFPELRRLDGLVVADGTISYVEDGETVDIGSYELERFDDDSVAVSEAEWCFPDSADD